MTMREILDQALAPKPKRFRCRCGDEFNEFWQLLEHIALYNSRWPEIRPTDRHGKIMKQEKCA